MVSAMLNPQPQGEEDWKWLLEAIPSRVVRVSFTEKVTDEHTPERNRKVSRVGI